MTSSMMRRLAIAALGVVSLLGLSACGGGGGDQPGTTPGGTATTYTLNATVSGLTGTGLVILNNGAGGVAITANGTVALTTGLANAATYSVTVGSQPAGQVCQVSAGSGTVNGANATVLVACAAVNGFTLSATVSGLTGAGLQLQNNTAAYLPVAASGLVSIATGLATGTVYNVRVVANPTGQTCAVINGFGTVAGANVVNVAVNCVTTTTPAPTFSISATVVGSTGTVTLQNNGGGSILVVTNGTVTLASGLLTGAAYNFQVTGTPAGQACNILNGAGSIGSANVTNIAINCTTGTAPTFSVSATISGINGTLVLQNNGVGSISIATNGTVLLVSGLPTGSNYSLQVIGVPAGQTCQIVNGSGTIGVANITNVMVTCVPIYTVTVTVSGATSGFTVRNNGVGSIAATNGTVLVATLAQGSTYSVTVATHPAGQFCEVLNGAGTISGASVSNIVVTCANVYGVTATVSGLTGTGLQLRNAGDSGLYQIPVVANGAVAISNFALSGEFYSVHVGVQPTGQTCTVTNGSGVVPTGGVSSIGINCVLRTTTYAVTATVTGLSGTGLILRNGTTLLPTVAPGAVSVTIANAVRSGTSYNVSVQTQPTATPAQYCRVIRGGGYVDGTNVTNIEVDCRDRVGKFLYVPSSTSANLSGYSINAATGALTPLAGFPVAPPSPPTAGAVTRFIAVQKTPDDQFLVVARHNISVVNSTDNVGTFSVYRIDATTGALTLASTFTTGPELRFAIGNLHPGGRQWVVGSWFVQQSGTTVTQDGDVQLNVLDINPTTGQLSIVESGLVAANYNQGDFGTAAFAQSAGVPLFHPSGGSISWPLNFGGHSYAITSLSADYVFRTQFNIGDFLGGMYLPMSLDALQTAPVGSSLQLLQGGGVGFDPTGKFLVAGGNSITTDNNAITGNVTAQTGTIAVLQLDPLSGAKVSRAPGLTCSTCWVFAPAFSADGRFVYLTNPAYQLGSSIINANPGGTAVGPGFIAGYGLNVTSGALTAVPGSPLDTGQRGVSLSGLTQHPTAPYVYLPVAGDGTGSGVAVLQRDSSTGSLVTLGGLVTAGSSASVRGLRVDPSGRYLYVNDAGTNQIHVYTTNPTTGQVVLSSSSSAGTVPGIGIIVGLQVP